MNFFKWAISNNILNYIKKNLVNIENDMNTLFKSTYGNKKKNNERKKRHEISVSATKTLSKQNVKITVSFD